MPLRIALSLLAVALIALPLPADEKKPPQLRDFPFWTAPKRPHATAFIPGLQVALQLTPEQCEKIEAACRETIDKPEARGKNAPGAAAAVEKLHALVGDILTADQKKLIEKMNDAYARSVEEVAEDFGPKLVAAKGNQEETAKLRKEQAEAVAAAFEKRLDMILDTQLRAKVKKAGDEQKKREEEARKTPKPKK